MHLARTVRIAAATAIVAGALTLVLANTGSARPADLCIVVDPLVELGCAQSATPKATAGSDETGDQSVGVRYTSTVPPYDPQRLSVTFKRVASTRAIRKAVAQAGATIVQAIPQINAYLLGVDPDRRTAALDSLDRSSIVATASQELLAEAFDTNPDDSEWPLQQGLRIAGFPKAWDVTRGSQHVVVAVVDTGVDPVQPDLQGTLVPGYDFIHSSPRPMDDEGHGTAVAGVIAARSNNHQGTAGVCWYCSIMPIKVLDSTGSGDDTMIAAGIVWAADHGAQVINLSLGGPGTSDELSNAIGYAVNKGVLVVAAAGNSGSTVPFYPAGDPRAISVAATTGADQRYSWSDFGAWVKVAAPGCNIAPILSGGYGNFCGTSSATPLVAGLIALELSARPRAGTQQVEHALEDAALPLPGLVQFGRIDAGRTLGFLSSSSPTPAQATEAVFAGAFADRIRTRTYSITTTGGELSATLEFTGTPRLTLSLTDPSTKRSLARAEGPSPVRLQATLPAGRFVVRVFDRTAGKGSFVLRVSYSGRRAR